MIDMIQHLAAGLILTAVFAGRAMAGLPEIPGPRCPDGKKPLFTGHPFHPYFCPGLQEVEAQGPPEGVRLSAAGLPNIKDKDKNSFKALVGRWEGMIVYGPNRFEILCDIKKNGSRSFILNLTTMDYRSHEKNQIIADLSSGYWEAGHYDAVVKTAALPELALKGQAWLGAVQPADPRAVLDREFDLVYAGRSDLHRLRFALEGKDKIRYSYTYLEKAGGLPETTGELTRSKRESL